MFVTHDPLDALLLADRVVVLSDGKVVEQGASSEVLSRPRIPFAARLAGLNLVAGTWRDGCVETPDGVRVHGLVVGEAPAPEAERDRDVPALGRGRLPGPGRGQPAQRRST